MGYVQLQSGGMIGTKLADGSVTGTLGIPHWILVSFICIGLFFLLLLLLGFII